MTDQYRDKKAVSRIPVSPETELEEQVRQRTTELEDANRQLRKIKAQFEAVYNHHYQLTGLIDREGRLLMGNKTALEFAGVESQDVVGKHFWETPWWTHSKKEQQKLRRAMERAMQGEMAHFESTHTSVSGELRNIDFRIRPVFDDKGKVIYLVPEGYDVTERKEAEKALRESEEKYRTFFQNSHDPMLMLRGGLVVDCNTAVVELLGFKDAEAVKNLLPSDLSPENQPDGRKSVEKEREMNEIAFTRGAHRFEWDHIKQNGEVFPVDVSLTAIPSKGETLLVAVWRDISEVKRAEEERKNLERQLFQAQKMEAIGTLAGGIAHDFNNILSAVIGYSEMLQSRVPKESTEYEYSEHIYKAGMRAKDLVQQILTFSRQADPELKPVEINIIVKEVSKLLRSSLPSTIEISHSTEGNPLVMGDATQLHQILMNLCTNAGHAMQEKGGLLTIELQSIELKDHLIDSQIKLSPGIYAQLSVSDTGHGIPAKNFDRIFDPFFTTKARGEGTGMGLSVVHGIVQSYKGAINVYSEAGKGTTIKIFLPAIERRAEPDKRETIDIPTGTEHILFVDDEPPIVEIATAQLDSLGYKVTSRHNSLEALELIKSKPNSFDLVVTDMTMPKMTGDELAKEIKRIRPDIPIILCTGFSSKIALEGVEPLDFDAILMKPIILSEMARIVREVLELV